METRKLAAISVLLGVAGFGGIQFVRPEMKAPPHSALLAGAVVPGSVAAVFERACQDCHSNNTRWPWYARISPFSLLVAQDVNRGRKFLNLSEWERYTKGRKLGYLTAMTLATSNRKMPPRVYTVMHPDARLSGVERTLIAAWAREESARVRAGLH